MVYQLVGKRKKYEIYLLFTDKNTSKSNIYQNIKDCENGFPGVVKPKDTKLRVADNKKVRYLLQSIINCVEAWKHHTL
jgi:hypothetical protein